MMKPLLFVLMALSAGVAVADESVKLVEVRKIWDQAPYNAFTSLTRFQGRWYCAFREGKSHGPDRNPGGGLRVITSADGKTWKSAVLMKSETGDLRDPQIVVTPDGRLMLTGIENLHDRSKHGYQSVVWFSSDGRTWSDRNEIGDPNFWLWRATWHKDTAYGIGYPADDKVPRRQWLGTRLYTSKDGKRFDTLLNPLESAGGNESSIVFDGDTAYCLLRRDPDTYPVYTGLLGTARPPYTSWEWKDLGTQIGGPVMLRLPDGRFVAAVRLYDGGERTSLGWVDTASGKFTECLRLPSGGGSGDSSYAGLVYHEGLLWVSYYSGHEGKTSIYLAKVRIKL